MLSTGACWGGHFCVEPGIFVSNRAFLWRTMHFAVQPGFLCRMSVIIYLMYRYFFHNVFINLSYVILFYSLIQIMGSSFGIDWSFVNAVPTSMQTRSYILYLPLHTKGLAFSFHIKSRTSERFRKAVILWLTFIPFHLCFVGMRWIMLWPLDEIQGVTFQEAAHVNYLDKLICTLIVFLIGYN